MKKPIVVVVGLDGASWYLLSKWIRAGQLPTFKKLVKHGVHSRLISTLPAMTCPAWKSLTSGLTPEQIGAFGFIIPNFRLKTCTFVDSNLLKGRNVWMYLSERGFKVCVINVPWSYPPSKVNGIFISGFPSTSQQDYTYPSSLKKLLTDIGYDIDLFGMVSIINKSRISLREYIYQISLKFSLARVAIRLGYSFVFLVIFYIDKLSHFLWDDDTLLKVYKSIDKELSALLSELDRSERPFALFIVSDHGMYPTYVVFDLNTWLYKEGYLKLNGKMPEGTPRKRLGYILSLIFRIGILIAQISVFSEILHLILTALSKRESTNRLLKRILVMSLDGKLNDVELIKYINLNGTRAIALQQCIYVLERNPKERDKLIKEIARKLEEIRDPILNRRVVRRCVITKLRDPQRWPAILLEPEKGVSITNELSFSLQPFKAIDRRQRAWIANHVRDGIFIAYGSIIKRNAKLSSVDIKDLAPTILRIYGLPRGWMMKGRVLNSILYYKSA